MGYASIYTTSNHRQKDYSFVENLLHESFPEAERRDDVAQRDNVDNCAAFTCYLISDNGLQVGLVTLWKLDGFSYVEHLATSPSVRNKGYGRKIMELLQQQFPGVVILEVEKPLDEWSRRRIGFYQRCGFSLCEKEYVQPSYRKGGETLPLYLMYAGTDSIEEKRGNLIGLIYQFPRFLWEDYCQPPPKALYKLTIVICLSRTALLNPI